MDTPVSIEDLMPTATCPLHHTVSVMIISPDSEQCGEDWHSLPPHYKKVLGLSGLSCGPGVLDFWAVNQAVTLVKHNSWKVRIDLGWDP